MLAVRNDSYGETSMYDQILLPTDGSDGTQRVVEQALHLARLEDATVHVLHVVDTSALPLDRHTRALYDELESRGEASVDEIRDSALDAGIHSVTAVRRGTPHEAILDYVDENDIDLLVLGTHGRRGLSRRVLGSVAEHVVRLSPVPVLTVRTLPAVEG